MEMEILYFNLKPSTTGDRTTGPTNDTQGNNAYSIPSRASQAWTGSSPSQTSVGIFQDGGAQAFTTGGGTNGNSPIYWTSTSSGSSGNAYVLATRNGYGSGAWGYYYETMNYGSAGDGRAALSCRAIRKVAI